MILWHAHLNIVFHFLFRMLVNVMKPWSYTEKLSSWPQNWKILFKDELAHDIDQYGSKHK